jgi:hypothetical protein
MGGAGFTVDIGKLRAFGGDLQKQSDRDREIAKTLSGVTANTGRADSDAMGRIGPIYIGEVVDDLGTEMADDAKLIAERADQYEQIDSDAETNIAVLYPQGA